MKNATHKVLEIVLSTSIPTSNKLDPQDLSGGGGGSKVAGLVFSKLPLSSNGGFEVKDDGNGRILNPRS